MNNKKDCSIFFSLIVGVIIGYVISSLFIQRLNNKQPEGYYYTVSDAYTFNAPYSAKSVRGCSYNCN